MQSSVYVNNQLNMKRERPLFGIFGAEPPPGMHVGGDQELLPVALRLLAREASAGGARAVTLQGGNILMGPHSLVTMCLSKLKGCQLGQYMHMVALKTISCTLDSFLFC